MMDIKTKRILRQTIKNSFSFIAFIVTFAIYTYGCMVFSKYLSDDYYLGFAFIMLPCIIACIWDVSRTQIERQMLDEERLVETLKREY